MTRPESPLFVPPEGKVPVIRLRKSIIVLSGLPFTGKTTLGRALEATSNARYFDIDKTRQEFFPPSDWYVERDERRRMAESYGRMYLKARFELDKGNPLVLGATFSRSSYKDALVRVARMSDSPIKVFRLTVSPEEVDLRLQEPQSTGSASVRRTQDEYELVRKAYNSPLEPDVVIETGRPVAESLADIVEHLQEFREDV